MTPEEGNRVALAAIRSVFDAAHGFEVSIQGTPVQVTVGSPTKVAWPSVTGLSEEADGKWPDNVPLRCVWDGGSVELICLARADRRAGANVSLAVGFNQGHWLGHTNVAAAVAASDEPEVAVVNWFGLKKRTAGESQKLLNRKLREIFAESGLPMLSKASVETFRIRVEDGSVLPSAREAFERLVHTCLIKLDFFSAGPKAAERGRPLIDLGSLGIELETSEDEDEDEDEEAHSYWAGGYGEPERLTAAPRARV